MTNPIDELIEKLPTGYTPGPWRAFAACGIRLVGYGATITHARNNPEICQLNSDFRNEDANADLIALAPEMATALTSLQERNRKLEEALREYMSCVAIASSPAAGQADVITLSEIHDRMSAAREAAEAALGNGRRFPDIEARIARALLSGAGEG